MSALDRGRTLPLLWEDPVPVSPLVARIRDAGIDETAAYAQLLKGDATVDKRAKEVGLCAFMDGWQTCLKALRAEGVEV